MNIASKGITADELDDGGSLQGKAVSSGAPVFHDIDQGTPEWLALRAQYFTASEAPAMLGVSKYMKRTELLGQKLRGAVREVSFVAMTAFSPALQK